MAERGEHRRRAEKIEKAALAWAAAFSAYWAFKGVTSLASLKAHDILDAAEKALLSALESREVKWTRS
jgi:hypothetical protein